jgi:hypothetical protein
MLIISKQPNLIVQMQKLLSKTSRQNNSPQNSSTVSLQIPAPTAHPHINVNHYNAIGNPIR